MRALVVHPGAELYGSDRMLVETVRGLAEHGDDVVVAVPTDGPLVPLLQAAGGRVIVVPQAVLRKAALTPRGLAALARTTLASLRPAWRLLGSGPDVVVVNTLTVPLWPVLARLRGVPAVCHVHEAEASAPGWLRRALHLPLLAARRVVCNSRFSLGVVTGAVPRLAARAVVLDNGVEGPADPRTPRERLDGPLRVLFVGRLSPRKGAAVAVEALALLDRRGVPARLDIAGSAFAGYEWYEEELRGAAARDGLEVRFHGFVPHVWDLLAGCDVLVVPSVVDEPFGNTAVEGLLALRPVVVSDTSGLREATEDAEAARLVPPDDAAALADALEWVAAEWAGVRERVLRDHARMAERFSPARYRAALRTVVAAAASPRDTDTQRVLPGPRRD